MLNLHKLFCELDHFSIVLCNKRTVHASFASRSVREVHHVIMLGVNLVETTLNCLAAFQSGRRWQPRLMTCLQVTSTLHIVRHLKLVSRGDKHTTLCQASQFSVHS